MENGYTDKEILGDALATEKTSTCNYNTYSNECVHNEVRDVMLKILAQEHEIQNTVFNMMHEKGYYPTPAADEKKVQEIKNKFAKCCKTATTNS
ncbi:MAG: spore coat protein [Lachnospiraceae bacterium]|nr:spore coat protein [Lachnospiraceae bacterium]